MVADNFRTNDLRRQCLHKFRHSHFPFPTTLYLPHKRHCFESPSVVPDHPVIPADKARFRASSIRLSGLVTLGSLSSKIFLPQLIVLQETSAEPVSLSPRPTGVKYDLIPRSAMRIANIADSFSYFTVLHRK